MSISWLQLLSKRLLLDFFLVSASQVMITDSINMFFYFFLDGLFQYACHKYSFFFSVLAILWFDDNDMDTLPQPNSYNITVEVLCRSVSVNWISCVRPQLFPPLPQWNQDFWEWNTDIHGLFQVFSVDFSKKHFEDWGTNSILPNTILLSSSVTLGGEVKSNCQTL